MSWLVIWTISQQIIAFLGRTVAEHFLNGIMPRNAINLPLIFVEVVLEFDTFYDLENVQFDATLLVALLSNLIGNILLRARLIFYLN